MKAIEIMKARLFETNQEIKKMEGKKSREKSSTKRGRISRYIKHTEEARDLNAGMIHALEGGK